MVKTETDLKKKTKISLSFVQAKGSDLKELDYYKELPNDEFKPIYKFRQNLPYWLISLESGEIEDQIYFLGDWCNKYEIAKWLEDGRIFIHKSHVRNL